MMTHDASPDDPTLSELFASLQRLARGLVHGADALDLVQDAMVAALTRKDPPTNLRAWMRQVVRNRFADNRRATHRRQQREATLVVEGFQSMDSEKQAFHRELLQALTQALAQLEAPYREVLHRRFIADQSTEQIARETASPLPTVRWRIHEGLQRVRCLLDVHFKGREQWMTALIPLLGPNAEAFGESYDADKPSSVITRNGGKIVSSTSYVAPLIGAALVLGASSAVLVGIWPQSPVAAATPVPTEANGNEAVHRAKESSILTDLPPRRNPAESLQHPTLHRAMDLSPSPALAKQTQVPIDPCVALLDPANVEDERIWAHRRDIKDEKGQQISEITAGSGCFPADPTLDEDHEEERQPRCQPGESPTPRPDVEACMRARLEEPNQIPWTWNDLRFASCRAFVPQRDPPSPVKILLRWQLDAAFQPALTVRAHLLCHATDSEHQIEGDGCEASEKGKEYPALATCIADQLAGETLPQVQRLHDGVHSLTYIWWISPTD